MVLLVAVPSWLQVRPQVLTGMHTISFIIPFHPSPQSGLRSVADFLSTLPTRALRSIHLAFANADPPSRDEFWSAEVFAMFAAPVIDGPWWADVEKEVRRFPKLTSVFVWQSPGKSCMKWTPPLLNHEPTPNLLRKDKVPPESRSLYEGMLPWLHAGGLLRFE